MPSKYQSSRPHVPASLRREAEVEAGHKCSVAHCNERIALELHHIDGNRDNNRIENVVLLCAIHHEMAERRLIDRKSLQTYKLLNRQKAGLEQEQSLSEEARQTYLAEFGSWLGTELGNQLEKQPLMHTQLRIFGTDQQPITKFDEFEAFLHNTGKTIILGNGGSGKTTYLLTWLRYLVDKAILNAGTRLPIYVSMSAFTSNTKLDDIIRASIGRFGISIRQHSIEQLLSDGDLFVVFDGINEISSKALNSSAPQSIVNFMNIYPKTLFVLSSRYIREVIDLDLPRLDITAWSKNTVQSYLIKRLGKKLGKETFAIIGDDVDFEWMTNSSMAGLCSNPLTLSMLAALAENKGDIPQRNEDIISKVIDLMVERISQTEWRKIPSQFWREILEEFAYVMLEHKHILSVPLENAIRLLGQLLSSLKIRNLLPQTLDAFDLLEGIIATGLMRQESNYLYWMHQIVHEHLSIVYSRKKFDIFTKICKFTLCPHCGYRLEDLYEDTSFLYGKCTETDEIQRIKKVEIPDKYKLRRKIRFFDHTGHPVADDGVAVPKTFFDDHYLGYLPLGGQAYLLAIENAHNRPSDRIVEYQDLLNSSGGDTPYQFDLEVWALAEAGVFQIHQKRDLIRIYIHSFPINPSARIYGYTLITLKDLMPEDLDESPEDRFGIVPPDWEEIEAQRRARNLPIYNRYSFVEDDKSKVFEVAKKHGGQIIREWGGIEEIVAEFKGEGWDFTGYNLDEG